MERNPSSSLTGAIRDYQSHLLTMSETYVRDIKHEWMICFGVPYGTNLWQVGNSKQQNGSYKMSMTKHKDEIVKKTYQIVVKTTVQRNRHYSSSEFILG